MVDGGLIAVCVIFPVLLVGFNLLVMAHYIDPQAAAGHFIAKIIIVRRAWAAVEGAAAPACGRALRVRSVASWSARAETYILRIALEALQGSVRVARLALPRGAPAPPLMLVTKTLPPRPRQRPPRNAQLLGMLIAEVAVLMLPLDVANQAGAIGCGIWNNNCGGFNMALAWQVRAGVV